MIKVGIVGISGYSGAMTLELLLKHKDVRVSYVSANNTTGKVADIWPHLAGKTKLTCHKFELKKCVSACELVFLAVPHTVSMKIAPALLKAGLSVIDLSGDYRLESISAYRKWYGKAHADRSNLANAVYGLPELYREDIKKARLVANPGCYPTAALLALAPLVTTHDNDIASISIDAKSGTSGAGRKASVAMNFSEVNENFKAYKVLKHQHSPEIDLYLSKLSKKKIKAAFVPHLLPVTRGILETVYVHFKKKVPDGKLRTVFNRFYKVEPFVRILPPGKQPELKNVVGSNMCEIGIEMASNGKLCVITGAIDNLIKGAAGQAVQNMNIINGFKETQGLV